MSAPIIAYRTCRNGQADRLDAHVCQLLTAGWELYGQPRYAPPTLDAGEEYQQTMIRRAASRQDSRP